MQSGPKTHVLVAAALIAAAGRAAPAVGQDAPVAGNQQANQQTEANSNPASAPTKPEDTRVRFNFSGAPFAQLLDFFSRRFGLPVIREAEPPAGTMTFISAEAYTLPEALEILNLNLAPHGVRLIREDNFLYLRSLNDAARKAQRVSGVEDLDGIDPTAYVTVTIPLNNAVAQVVAEQIKPLVKKPGMVQSIQAQNLLVIVETAAQVKRLREVVRRIDDVKPADSEYRLFPLEYADPANVVSALKGLVGRRIVKQIIEKDGSVREVEEVDLAGLSIEADPRTNSVIAVGSSSRLQTVEELVTLLDQPEGGIEDGDVRLSTFDLHAVTPAEAAKQLERLFGGMPQSRRPTILPLETTSKIVIVGRSALVTQAAALLSEVDPGLNGADAASTARTTRVLPLEHVAPNQLEQIARRMLSPRQNQMLRTAPSPGGGLLVSGPEPDVAAIATLAEQVDVKPEVRREVRRVRIDAGDPEAIVAEAKRLDALTDEAEDDPVETIVDAESSTVTLVGSRAALGRFEERLREAERGAQPTRVRRELTPEHVRPSTLAGELRRAAPPLLRPADGPEDGDAAYREPTFEALDELGVLLVTAEPGQFETIERLASEFDAPDPSGRELRILPLSGSEPLAAIERAQDLYTERTAGMDDREAGPIDVEIDREAGRALVRGTPGGVRLFESILNQTRELAPPEREPRIYEIGQTDAEGLMEPLRRMLEQAGPIDPARDVPPAGMQIAAGIDNALRIVAEPAQHRRIAEFLRLLDRPDIESRSYALETAQPSEIAGRLQRLARPLLQPTDGSPYRPPSFDALDELDTLIVRAAPGQFGVIEGLIDQLDAQQPGDRQIKIIPLGASAPEELLERARTLYVEQAPGVDGAGEIRAELDADSGNAIVRGTSEGVSLFSRVLDDARRLLPPERTTRMLDVENVDSQSIVSPLRELLASADPIDPSRAVPDPKIRVIERTNSLMVTAEPAQHRLIADFVERLDSVEPAAMPPLRLLQLRTADPNAVAQMLTEQYESRPPEQRAEKPVRVRADGSTGTLIVSAHEDLFEEIKSLVTQLNDQPADQPERETFIFPLETARAVDVAQAMDRLYPQPPVPRDRRGRPMPWLQEPKEVTVSADPSSNSLIIDAPAVRRPSLERLATTLDRVEAPDQATLRTYRVTEADLEAVARMLEGLVRRGAIEGPSKPGSETPEVVIETEPQSQTLIVGGNQDTFAQVEEILSDLTAVPKPRDLRIVPIEGRDAAAVRDRALEIYRAQTAGDDTAGEVEVAIDEATNTLEIVAAGEAMTRFTSVIEQLQRQAGPTRDLRFYELEIAEAAEVVNGLRDLVAASERLSDTPGPAPAFEAIASANAIMIAARPEQFAVIEPLVRSVDSRQAAGDIELRSYEIARADLGAVERTLRELAASDALGVTGRVPVTINTEPASRTLIVSGPSEIFERIESVIDDLDERDDRPATVLRLYRLEHARAEKLVELMSGLLETRLRETLREGGEAGVREAPELLDVSADRASNTLIISAPEAVQAIAEQLIGSLDTEAAATGRSVIRVLPLTYAESRDVARTLNDAVEGMELPAGGPVTITAAEGSNALLLAGAKADLEKVESLVEPLDRQPFDPAQPSIETFELEHASAAEIAETVERLLIDQRLSDPRLQRLQLLYSRGRLPDEPRVSVEAEDRTNSLIVSGPKETVELAASVVERLDRPASDADRRVATFTPARADPQRLADSIRRVIDQTEPSARRPLEIVVEPSSRTLLLIGSERQTERAQELAQRFDDQTPAMPVAEVRTFTLQHTAAGTVASTLRSMLGDRARWPEAMRRAADAGLSIPRVTVQPDDQAGRVLVSAAAPLMPMAASLVETLDKPRAGGSVDVRVFRLSEGKADSVAATVREALRAARDANEPAPSVSAEPTSNTVVVSGSATRLEQAADLIEQMDAVAAEPAEVGVRTIFLKHARADAVAPIVQSVLAEEDVLPENAPWWTRYNLRRERLRAGEDVDAPAVRVEAEPRLNAIVVSAPLGMLELAEEVVAGLDVDPSDGPGGQRSLRVLTLVNADAAELAENIEAVFSEDETAARPPTVRVDRGSNALIVSATPEQMTQIESLAERIDNATLSTRRELRTIPIDRSRADASEIARSLRRLLERGGGVEVEVLSIEDLMNRSEREAEPPEGDASSRAPRGVGSRGTGAELLMASAFAALQPEDEPPKEEGAPEDARDEDEDEQEEKETRSPVTIAVDPATNSLIVEGSPRLTERISELARQLEQEMPPEATDVRIVELPTGVDPNGVARIVNQTISRVGRASRDNPGGFTGRVGVTPDRTSGSLIVWANEADFGVIGDVVAAVARGGESEAVTVKVYPLTNTDARQAASAVSDLVSPTPRGRQARRVRGLDLTVEGPAGERTSGEIDPSTVSVTSDPSRTMLIVSAPESALDLIDRFVGLIDQSPVAGRVTIERYELENAEAGEMSRTVQRLLDGQRQGRAGRQIPRARVEADERTNAILVTATAEQHEEVARILETSDVPLETEGLETVTIALEHARPSAVEGVIDRVIVGRDASRAGRVELSAQDETGQLVVRTTTELLDEIRGLIDQLDVPGTGAFPVRSIKLERADAKAVADELQRFFQQRARVSGQRGGGRSGNAAIIGDRGSGTIVIAASDEDYEQIAELARQFDQPSAEQQSTFKVVELENASASSVADTLQSIADDLRFERMYGQGGGDRQRLDGRVLIEANERTNSLLIFGEGSIIETVENVIAELDRPASEMGASIVKAVRIENADLRALERLIEQVTADPERPWWRSGRDPEQVLVEVDQTRNLLLLVGQRERVEEAAGYLEQVSEAASVEGQRIETISLQHADAGRAARSLQSFFDNRARAEQTRRAVAVIGSRDGNVLMVSAPPDDMELVRELVSQIDRPELGENRRIEVYRLDNADPGEVAGTVRNMFPRRGPAEDQVIVTPQPSINALIISAPDDEHAHVETLLSELDRVRADESGRIMRIPLESARAGEVAALLREALPGELRVRITPDDRTNTLLVSGSQEALDVVSRQVSELDTEVEQQPVVFRRFELEHADDSDLAFTLREMLRARPRERNEPSPTVDYSLTSNAVSVTASPDEMKFIEEMVGQLDVAEESERRTEFVNLEFAEAEQAGEALSLFFGRFAPEARTAAEREVSIYSDAASNSLVISGPESVFEKVKGLLGTLDTPAYDTSKQLVVIPLEHADARSVARALNEGFRAPLEQELRREEARERDRGGARGDREGETQFGQRTVLVSADETPSVSAEIQTNALVVFASRQDLERIRTVVDNLDVPEFQRLPAPRLVEVEGAVRPTQLAERVRRVFEGERGGGGPNRTVIVGDDEAGVLIVRAGEDAFARVRDLARSLMDKGERAALAPRLIRLHSASAARLRPTLVSAFRPIAQRRGEELVIEADRARNTLIVSASEAMHERIERLARDIDGPAPEPADAEDFGADAGGEAGAQAAIDAEGDPLIVGLEHVSPDEMIRLLRELGVTEAPSDDRPSLVAEAVRLVPMRTRRAVAVLAGPADREKIGSIIRRLDAEPPASQQSVAVVPLKEGEAGRIVGLLNQMLEPSEGDGKTDPAAALAEQIRRLRVQRGGRPENGPLDLDLSEPIKLLADPQTNSVIIASSPANVAGLRELVKMFDGMPVGDAVVVRIMPLESASASRVRRVIEDLFERGEALARTPGTRRDAKPTTTTGQALVGEIAVSVDDRTNALIVAGREEAVALVEVLVRGLDEGDADARGLDAAMIELEHADPVLLSRKLREVLIEGIGETPDAIGLQRQVGRLRLLVEGAEGEDAQRVESDLFAPLTDLVITPEENLGALIVIGTPTNLEVVRELVSMLDVERASASNSVRVIPLEHAQAGRVASVAQEIFDGRSELETSRPEDRLIMSVDERTNALVVSTSPRSFDILDGLIRTLDQEESRFAVGMHVIPVPDADAGELAPKIQRLMRDRLEAARERGGRESPLDVFSIEAVPSRDLLIVAASDENLGLVRELVAALTEDPGVAADAERFELIPLETSGRAVEVAEQIDELYVERENEKRGERSVSVVASERQNALLVSGTDADIEAIRELAASLDVAEAEAVQEVKRIPLRAANAFEITRLLEELLAGRPISGGRDGAGARQATRLRFFRNQLESVEETTTEATIDGALRDQVRLTPDLRTNSLMVAAPPPLMELIGQVVRDLDAETSGDRRVEQYRLENADAQQMALLLQDLFNLEQQGDRLVLVPRQQRRALGDNEAGPLEDDPSTLTPVPDLRQALAITVDRRTNTLLVSATPDYLSEVREVVTELDDIEANERERRVYELNNAQAIEAQETLRSFFEGESELRRTTLGPQLTGSLARQLEQEVTVVGDEKSNKLLISASPRYMGTVERLIQEIDKAPPQVLIQVLLAEVTLDDEFQWGVDFNVGLDTQTSQIGGDGFVFEQLAAGAGVATALGVPNFSVLSQDFRLLIRALEVQGKLEVLSRPHVMVRNNEDARIQVAEDVGIVVGTDAVGERVSVDVERRPVGIILDVRPSISPDGTVRLQILPEISTLTSRTIEIGEGVDSPVISERNVETTVTVADGQTVVIGGLIQTTNSVREEKIPLLGDLPLVGPIFRSIDESSQKTELLVVLTPMIIPGDKAAAVERQEEILNNKLGSLADPTTVQEALDEDQVWVPEDAEAWWQADSPGVVGAPDHPEVEDPNPEVPPGEEESEVPREGPPMQGVDQ